MTSTRSARSPLSLVSAIALALAGCATDGAPGAEGPGGEHDMPSGDWVPIGAADGSSGPTFARCRVEAGSGDRFFRTDVLHCAATPAPWLVDPRLEVWSSAGFVGTLTPTEDEATLSFFASSYPLEVRATVGLSGLVGVDSARLRRVLAIARAEDLPTFAGIALPLDAWRIDVEARTSFGLVDFPARDLPLGDATIEGPELVASLAVGREVVRFAAESRRTLLVPVARGEMAVVGAAGSIEMTSLRPFRLDGPGAYVLRGDGLLRASDVVSPPGGGPDLVRCRTTEATGELGCALVTRAGITVGDARIERDGVATSLPPDGSTVAVGPRGTGAVVLRVVVASFAGVGGLTALEPLALDDTLTIADGASGGALDWPIDLLHVRFVSAPTVARAFFDADAPYPITFRRRWGTRLDAQAAPRLVVGPAAPEAWVAVPPGHTGTIAGQLTVVTSAGAVAQAPLSLRGGAYVLTPGGALEATVPAPGTLLASCWVEDGSLTCDVSETAPILDASIAITLDRLRERPIVRPLSWGRSSILAVGPLLPLNVSVSVEALGLGTPIVAEARLEGPADLAPAAPLEVRVP